MKAFGITIVYALALALLWAGTQTAPQTGWPTTDVQMHGCALLILGVIVKTIGHWLVLAAPHARMRIRHA
jgi:hypothetical protein